MTGDTEVIGLKRGPARITSELPTIHQECSPLLVGRRYGRQNSYTPFVVVSLNARVCRNGQVVADQFRQARNAGQIARVLT